MTTSLLPLTSAQSDYLDQLSRGYALRTEQVLQRIARSTVPVSSATLRQELGLDRTVLSTTLSRLVQRHLIQRVSHGLYLRDPLLFSGLVSEIFSGSPD